MLRFAEEWTRKSRVSEEVVTRLQQHLGDTQMVVLAATVELANWTNRFNETFRVELP